LDSSWSTYSEGFTIVETGTKNSGSIRSIENDIDDELFLDGNIHDNSMSTGSSTSDTSNQKIDWDSHPRGSIWGSSQRRSVPQQEEEIMRTVWGNGAGFGSRGKRRQNISTTGSTEYIPLDPAHYFDTIPYPINIIPISTLGMRFRDKLVIEDSNQTYISSRNAKLKVQNLLFNEIFSAFPPSLIRYYDYICVGNLPLAKSGSPDRTFGQGSFMTQASNLPPKSQEFDMSGNTAFGPIVTANNNNNYNNNNNN